MGKMKRRAPRGGGKMNQKNMMKQLQKMQSEMAQAQANLEEQEVQGTAGGGAVTAPASARRGGEGRAISCPVTAPGITMP